MLPLYSADNRVVNNTKWRGPRSHLGGCVPTSREAVREQTSAKARGELAERSTALENTQGASGSSPTRHTRAPARRLRATRPWIDALLIPARTVRFFGHGIRRRDVRIGVEAPAPEQATHPRGDRREHNADLFVRRGRRRVEAQRVPLAFGEDAVEDERVEVERPSRIPHRCARRRWKASSARA